MPASLEPIVVESLWKEMTAFTLAALANGAARASNRVQQCSQGESIALQAHITVGAGMSSASYYSLFLSTSIDGDNWLGHGVDGTDKVVTVPSTTNLLYLGTVYTPNSSVVVPSPEFDLRTIRGIPRKPAWWSVIALNGTGAAFTAGKVLWRPVG